MTVDFIRFKASDGLELQGWLSNVPGDTAVLHVHGRSGNGYENVFLDNLRELYVQQGITFFAANNRGHGVQSWFSKGGHVQVIGSCYELFDDCLYDIEGAL